MFSCAIALARPAIGRQIPGGPAPAGTSDTGVVTGQIAPTTFLPISVHYELREGMPVVKAILGEAQQQDAVIATGLPLCLVAPDTAAKLFVKTSGVQDMSALYGKIQVSKADAQNLRVGAIAMSAVPFGVFDLAHYLSARATVDAPAVWIGNSGLGAFSVTIDPTKQEIVFNKANAPLPKKAILVPFELKDGRIWVQAKANGKKTFSALVDTTAVGTLLPAGIARSLNLPAATILTAMQPGGKESKVGVLELRELAIGDAKAGEVQAIYCADEKVDGFDADLGVIGCDLLMRYKVTIDYGRRVIAFEKLPNQAAPKPAGQIASPQPTYNPRGTYRPGGVFGPTQPTVPPSIPTSRP